LAPLTGVESGVSDWWHEELRKTAESLARQPLVLLDKGRAVPAIAGGEGKDDPLFPLPLLTSDDPQDAPFGPIWSLQHRLFRDVPPEPVAADWQSIVRGWESLDVQAKSCTIESLVSYFPHISVSLSPNFGPYRGGSEMWS
jgi:hypothetical protein